MLVGVWIVYYRAIRLMGLFGLLVQSYAGFCLRYSGFIICYQNFLTIEIIYDHIALVHIVMGYTISHEVLMTLIHLDCRMPASDSLDELLKAGEDCCAMRLYLRERRMRLH